MKGVTPNTCFALLTVLAGATVYEALVAAGVIELGSLPGEGAPGEGVIRLCAFAAVVAGAALAALAPGTRCLWFLAPAGAAFLIARFYTFDPYYLPTLRRMSDDGIVPPWLVYAVAAVAVLAAVLVHRGTPGWRTVTSLVLLASGVLAVFASAGH
jgi:hypothetical protein